MQKPQGDFASIPYVRTCVLLRQGRPREAMLCTLGVRGTYITFARSLAEEIPNLHEELHVTFLLPGESIPISAEATVTWKNIDEPGTTESLPPGCGVRFTSMSPDDRQRIAELVADYRDSPQPRIAAPAPHSGLTRIPYVHSCLLTGEIGTWEGVLSNISLNGAYIALDPIPAHGEQLQLLTHLPGETALVQIPVEVVWVNPHEPSRMGSLPPGCGVRFVSLVAGTHERIEEMIAAYESPPRET